VPVPPAMLRVLDELRMVTGTSIRVFDGVSESNAERNWWGRIRDRAMSHGAEAFTKHDLRRTCATGCNRGAFG